MKLKNLALILSLFSLVIFFSCGDSDEEKRRKKLLSDMKPSPVDDIIRDMSTVDNFSVILHDMDVNDELTKFKHQYRIITMKDTVPQDSTTKWFEVSEAFFVENSENMGMEIASKKDGKVSKVASPPGYSNYVGNEKYGQWKSDPSSGRSYWSFYPAYSTLGTMFLLSSMPIYRSGYMNYRSHYNSGRPYYGTTSGGGRRYGTGSTYANKTRSSSTWSRKMSNSSFKQKVNSRVSQSRSALSGRSSGKSSRSGSRYSGSSRSRSGSYGK